MSLKSSYFNSRTFTLLAINYVVGFGFVATISKIAKLGIWALAVILPTALIALGVVLVFSRLVNEFPKDQGGSFSYANRVSKGNFAFFVGWNQYIQGPLYAGSGTLFLVKAAQIFTDQTWILNLVRGVSIVFFILLIFISTFGVTLSKKVIFFNMLIKWIVLAIGFGGLVYLAFNQRMLVANFTSKLGTKVDTFLIFSSSLTFMFAFGGIEMLPTLAPNTKFQNFRKILMTAFIFVFTFYLIGYLLFVSTNLIKDDQTAFISIYRLTMGLAGTIIFAVYIITYNIASSLTSTLAYGRTLAALSNAGYLPKFLGLANKENEFKNAIWFNFGLTVISLLIFSLLPLFIPSLNNFFDSVINLGTICFLMQYIMTFISALILEWRKEIKPIFIVEKILYVVVILLVGAIMLVNFFPFLAGSSFKLADTIVLVSYVIANLLGFGFYKFTQRQRDLHG
ncbi:APC family permease [Mycoplasmopsis gallopavonis]|uniref:Amino acid permease n=1 Tax=Mycoplasmopsis gallopavonis TaxID=76629 RepID=A0A449AZY4_9BACT|nr:APC family permease [Mycoplasmopsis gallopavonis]RIV16894.1 amino acid permease [Mycoplasmopsis gallopavonis]VEU73026.1 Uncharacterised protein [Mycoplasmopsis gallopavonis]